MKFTKLKYADKDKLYYLASPYSHSNPFVMQFRYESIIYAAQMLTKKGFRLIEPIGMCHSQSVKYDLPGGYDFWKTRDRGFIDVSDGVIIATLPGWKKSKGVTDELHYAKQTGKPIFELPAKELFPKQLLKDMVGGIHTI